MQLLRLSFTTKKQLWKRQWSKLFCAVKENQQQVVEQKNETLQVNLSLEPKETSNCAEMEVNCWRMERVFGAELQRVSALYFAQTEEACGLESMLIK